MLDGHVVLVSGGGAGIGRAVAHHLSAMGAFVAVNDLGTTTDGVGASRLAADGVVDEIALEGGAASAHAWDVSDRDAVQALVDGLVEEHGRVDAVVNTAGLIRNGDLTTYSDDDWARHQGVHIGGHLNLLDAALPAMKQHGLGRVVFFTSGSGLLRASSALSAYGAGKRAIAELVWHLAPDLPPGVTLNALAPLAATRMHAQRPKGRSESVWGSEDSMPPAEAIAPVVAALVLDGSVHGQVLYTNGAEVSVVSPPESVEVVHLGTQPDDALLDAALTAVLGPAAVSGGTTGAALPRLPAPFARPEARL